MPELLQNFFANPLLPGSTLLVAIFAVFAYLQFRRREERQIIQAFLDAASIPLFSTTLPRLKNEVSRSRRYQHELSVVIFRRRTMSEGDHEGEAARNNFSENGIRSSAPGMSRLEFLLLGPILKDAIRTIDMVTYDAGNNQFIILLPESSKIQAVQATNRLKKILGSKITANLLIGIAEFPRDGLIIEDLIARATPGAQEGQEGENLSLPDEQTEAAKKSDLQRR